MKELFDAIDKRVHLPENEERYRKLCLHTSEVAGGKEFLEKSEKAAKLLKTINENTDSRLNHVAQYRRLIDDMTDWLDDNGWV